MSIPRLELSAAVVAVELANKIKKELELPVQKLHFWTDSTSVLQYIRNERRRFKVYVANRVATIHEGSEPSQWKYVDTKSNPADDASRGLNGDQMITNERWLKGPSFLWKSEEFWPDQPVILPELTEDDDNVKKEVQAHQVNVQSDEEEKAVDKFFNKFSSWYRLKKGVAWLLRYKTYIIHKYSQKDATVDLKKGNLEVKEIQDAESEIIKYVQGQEK